MQVIYRERESTGKEGINVSKEWVYFRGEFLTDNFSQEDNLETNGFKSTTTSKKSSLREKCPVSTPDFNPVHLSGEQAPSTQAADAAETGRAQVVEEQVEDGGYQRKAESAGEKEKQVM